MADYTIVAGDTAPVFLYSPMYSDGTPVDGTTIASVTFAMRTRAASAPLTLTGATTYTVEVPTTFTFSPSTADTTTAGDFDAQWVVTFLNGQKMSWPTVGWLWVSIEPNLTTPSVSQLIGLPELKDYLDIPANEHGHDAKLLSFIASARPVIENITGPIIPIIRQEWHDGGQTFIELDWPPATGMGTSPVLTLIACSEWRGPIEYALAVIQDPSHGSIYSCMLDPLDGTVTRRSAGGSVIPFAWGEQCIRVTYQTGQAAVPECVKGAIKEVARVNYRTTQPTGVGRETVADAQDTGAPLGFFLHRRALEYLAPIARAPAVA